jgi:hypothetical protein
VHGLHDLAPVDALEADGGDAEVALSELALDDDRYVFARHLHGVAYRSWCGTKRRRTPAAAAVRRSSAATGDQWRPRVVPLMTHSSEPRLVVPGE